MAGDWIKMRVGLESDIKTLRIAKTIGIPVHVIVYNLYLVACWFSRHGKYGKIACEPSLIDSVVFQDGFAEAMINADWLRHEHGNTYLGTYCDVSSVRKSLGTLVRSAILSDATCEACGSSENLVVDHIIPVVRGGSSDLDNLQALCWTCNAKKGKKTMREFMEATP